ncbi:MAG: hypothetical protein OIF48_17340 [Silicimonas sp.]|nr:hypothetical protein [Silicimonas sp.]
MILRLAFAASLLLASPAAAFRAQNDMQVIAEGAGFHVAYRGGRAGVSDFWCAAGDYVIRDRGQPGATRIYRTSGVPRRAGDGMRFSLSPEGAKPTGLLRPFGSKTSVSAAEARFLCEATRNARN